MEQQIEETQSTFSLDRIQEVLLRLVEDPDNICVETFVEVLEQISYLISKFGRVIKPLVNDINNHKEGLLHTFNWHKNEKNVVLSLQQMVQWDIDKGISKLEAYKNQNVLRKYPEIEEKFPLDENEWLLTYESAVSHTRLMNRLLVFVQSLFTIFNDAPQNSFSSSLYQAYTQAYANYNSWGARNACWIGFKCVGTKENFLKKTGVENVEDLRPAQEAFEVITKALDKCLPNSS